ncbi:MAG TPA: hypothetical protein PK675_03565 [Clostridia bacterium]|nr:hypothetical protein [Clostridia bacterium]
MKKRNFIFLILLTIIFSLFVPQTVFADIGPKPQVEITFSGLEDQGEYYVTLLSEKDSLLGYQVYDPTDENTAFCSPEDEDYDIWLKFVNYVDSDGFYFLQHFTRCDDDNHYRWGYCAPSVFKVLIYFPEKDAFIVSDIYDSYAMSSYFHANVSIDNIENGITYFDNITLKKSYDYTWEAVSLLARIVGTIGIEILFAIIFRYKSKKQLMLILYTNIATQVILNVALNIIAFYFGWLAFSLLYIVTEIPVFIIEGIVYSVKMPKYIEGEKKRIWLVWIYAFVANLMSFAIGALLAYFVPGIFM